jgi:SWI/SNF-related matrix-associated actin-dependent regulator of chromatin subfamily A-like protein 1
MSAALWPHQLDVLPAMTAGNYFLAWEPGCGKTFPAVKAGALVEGRQLYLCPAALRHQVGQEAALVRPDAKIQVIRQTYETVDPEADVVVVSYSMVSKQPMWAQLFKLRWASIVLDEAHQLKNPEAKRTRAIYGARPSSPGALFKKADRVWVLTGTPIVNNPADIWIHYARLFPQAVLSDLGKTLTQRQWIERFCVLQYTNFGERIVGGKNLPELREKLEPYIDRKRIEDVIKDIPDEPIINVVPLDGERLSFTGIPEEQLAEVEAAVRGESLDGLEVATATLRKRIAYAKAAAVAELVKAELEGGRKKVIVFGQHPDALKLIQNELAVFGCVLITGEVPPVHRAMRVDAFREQASIKVFLGQTDATGTGLNLQVADRVIFLDAPWTPAAVQQAIARAHRAGQMKRVFVSFCSLRGSIDERVQKVLATKAKIIDQVFN